MEDDLVREPDSQFEHDAYSSTSGGQGSGHGRTEEALRESAERYRRLIENSPETIALLSEDKIVYVNAAGAKLMGADSPEELIGKPYMDLVHPDFREAVRSRTTSVERGAPVDLIQEKLLRLDGSVVEVEAVSIPTSHEGKPAVLSFIRDVTERRYAERRLRESEERYRAVVEQSVEAIYLYDAETKRVFESNAAFRKLIGYHAEELHGLKIYEFISHDKEDIDANVQRSLREKRRHIGERRYRRKDGSLIEVDTSATVIYYDGKLALCAVSRDLTERKRAEEALRHSEERFRSLVQNVSDLITVLDTDGTIRYESPAVERMLGYKPEERVGASAFEYIHPEDTGRMRRSFAEALDSSGVRPQVEFRVRHKDGSWRHLEVTRTNLLSDPAVRGVVANSRDVTERKIAEQALAEERNLLRTLIDNMPDFIFVKDAESRFVLNNAAHARALGATEEELLGKTDFDIFAHRLAQRYYSDEREVIRTGLPLVDKEEPITDGEGLQRWLSTTKVPLRNSEGDVTGLVGISRDMTDRKHLEEQLRHRAFHDLLTNLPNRALFLDRLEHAMARTPRVGGPVAVLFIDLDDFKVVNDSLGHEMGDRLLVAVAERLDSCVRPGDTVARIFGDEFAVLLEAPSGIEDAERIVERMKQRLREPFDIGGREVFVTFCAGIALGERSTGLLPTDVLWRADLAMFEAKAHGKNAYQTYQPSINTRATERLDRETALRRAVERQEFAVHYQPIIDLRAGKASGVEALVRWRHPQHGLLNASEFIVLAEKTGLIGSIDEWVIEKACKQAIRWKEQYPDNSFLLSVNLSAAQFSRHPDLISEVLSSTGLEPSCLQIEITERAVMNNAEFAIGKLQSLKNLGVQFAIDDYGTGYSCLSYLKRMPVDSLKIDRSFVSGLGNSPSDAAIIAATVDLAHALGLKVVAEGVENAHQLVRLRKMGCDLAQGFHLGRPLGAEAASKLLFEGRGW